MKILLCLKSIINNTEYMIAIQRGYLPQVKMMYGDYGILSSIPESMFYYFRVGCYIFSFEFFNENRHYEEKTIISYKR